MFTGTYKDKMERVENVIINTSVLLFVVMVVLKVVGIADITLLQVSLPITVPVVGVIGLLVILKILEKVGLFIYNVGEKLRSVFHGFFGRG